MTVLVDNNHSSSSSSKRIPLTPGRDREIFPRPTADSQSHRPGRTQVGSASACILVLFSPPGRCRSGNARTAPRLDQKLCGRHDQPVQSLSLLSLSFFVSRRARPIRLAPRALSLSLAFRAHSLVSTRPSLPRARLVRPHSSVSQVCLTVHPGTLICPRELPPGSCQLLCGLRDRSVRPWHWYAGRSGAL